MCSPRSTFFALRCGERIRCREPHQPQPPTRNPVSLTRIIRGPIRGTFALHIQVAPSNLHHGTASDRMLINGFVSPACTLHSRPLAGSVRPGLARSVPACVSESESLPVAPARAGPRATGSRGFSGCSSAADAPISSAINCDGTGVDPGAPGTLRPPTTALPLAAHWNLATCSGCQRLGLDREVGPLCTPPWPVFVLGICRCTDVKCHRS